MIFKGLDYTQPFSNLDGSVVEFESIFAVVVHFFYLYEATPDGVFSEHHQLHIEDEKNIRDQILEPGAWPTHIKQLWE